MHFQTGSERPLNDPHVALAIGGQFTRVLSAPLRDEVEIQIADLDPVLGRHTGKDLVG
jgi:hypothetical protein